MARFSRLDVLNMIIRRGLAPLSYHVDVEVAKARAGACCVGMEAKLVRKRWVSAGD
jgi:hypothetical protein